MLVSVEKTFFDKECKFEIIQAKEVQAREEKKDIKKNLLMTILCFSQEAKTVHILRIS